MAKRKGKNKNKSIKFEKIDEHDEKSGEKLKKRIGQFIYGAREKVTIVILDSEENKTKF